jgi:hypothetical protein
MPTRRFAAARLAGLVPSRAARAARAARAIVVGAMGAVGALGAAGALQTAAAGPFVPPGDASLRADIALLADHGVIRGPVTTWPLAWGPILEDLEDARLDGALPAHVAQALERMLATARGHARTGEPVFRAALSGAEQPSRIRSFADGPRESAEIAAGVEWTGHWLALDLEGQLVSDPGDGREARADGSAVAVALGNFAIAASTLERWWGPGWDGSLILSHNARPMPALSIDRTFTDAFESRWLGWIGPWDLSVVIGQMETDRAVPDARFFALRFNFRPLPGLEIGLSRAAQWCGDGRPCDLDVFVDLLLGRDNRGDDAIDLANEPGNQLAGLDFRWSLASFAGPLALYGQLIGEDEAGGFPSRYLAQLGLEGSAYARERWSVRWFGEMADTSCGFYESEVPFNCAYNHGIYRTGYRYRGRAVGHGIDNDGRVFAAGLVLTDEGTTRWSFLARYGELNRGGAPDPRHTLTPVAQDLASFDVSWSSDFRYGVIEIGAGAERTDDTDLRGYVRWQSSR